MTFDMKSIFSITFDLAFEAVVRGHGRSIQKQLDIYTYVHRAQIFMTEVTECSWGKWGTIITAGLATSSVNHSMTRRKEKGLRNNK